MKKNKNQKKDIIRPTKRPSSKEQKKDIQKEAKGKKPKDFTSLIKELEGIKYEGNILYSKDSFE